MAMPAGLIGQEGTIEMAEIEWLKAQKVSDDRTLQAQRQRVEKLDRELRKSRDKIHRRNQKNRKLLRKNRALGRKLEGKEEEAFRLRRLTRRELVKFNDETMEKFREAAQLAEYHSKDANAKVQQIDELQQKLQKITKEKDEFKYQASNARMELTIAKTRVDEELANRQLTTAALVESYYINEINRLQGETISQSGEIEHLKCCLQISLKAVAVLDGTESPLVVLEQIKLAVQIAHRNQLQNDQKSSQLREDVLRRKIAELKELAKKAETITANAKDHASDLIESKNESERKLVAEERKSNQLWGQLQILEDQHKAAIWKLTEQHTIAKEKLKSQYSTKLMERTNKIVDWLAQDAEENAYFFQRQFELVREENARLQLKTSWSKFGQLQRENEQLQWELRLVRKLTSQAKEKAQVAPQASEQTLTQTAATPSTDTDAPRAEETSCPIEGIWEHTPVPSAFVKQDTFAESFQCTPNLRNRNRDKMYERSEAIFYDINPNLSVESSSIDPKICRFCQDLGLEKCGFFCSRSRARRLNVTKGRATDDSSKDQESTAAKITRENSEEEISEASTSVAENSEMGESTDSPRADDSGSASNNEESTIAENNSKEADTEIQANLNMIANTDNDHAAEKEEANCVQSNFEEVQEHDGHVVSHKGQAEIHDEDDEDDFTPRLWKILSWVTLIAVFLHRLQTLGLLKIPINEVDIESPDFSSLRSIVGIVDSESQTGPSNGVVSLGLDQKGSISLPIVTLATRVPDAPKCEGWMEEYIQSVIMLPEPTSSSDDTPVPEPVFKQSPPVSTWSSITDFFNTPYKVAGWGLGAGSAWVAWQQSGVISAWWR